MVRSAIKRTLIGLAEFAGSVVTGLAIYVALYGFIVPYIKGFWQGFTGS